jgi:pSer/pThr/pTyr-binding forkhead associated (FHA) protein
VSPVAPHTSTPQELKERLSAERAGEPHVIVRDAGGHQIIHTLPRGVETVTIGRDQRCEISVEWDAEVSRAHAELHLVGSEWTLVDDGLSRNGSFVNGERIQGRRRLRDLDELVVGRTAIVFRAPVRPGGLTTRPGLRSSLIDDVSAGDRRVLVALCRPMLGQAHALPATNKAIAEEVSLNVGGVKKRLTALFARFELSDLPQSEKRTRLAIEALQRGIVSPREL